MNVVLYSSNTTRKANQSLKSRCALFHSSLSHLVFAPSSLSPLGCLRAACACSASAFASSSPLPVLLLLLLLLPLLLAGYIALLHIGILVDSSEMQRSSAPLSTAPLTLFTLASAFSSFCIEMISTYCCSQHNLLLMECSLDIEVECSSSLCLL